MRYAHSSIRFNLIKMFAARFLLITGIILLLYDYWIVYLTPYWNFDLMLEIFIIGIVLMFLAFTGKIRRYIKMRRSSGISPDRTGECKGCGACCRIPVHCIYRTRSGCRIYEKRPRQCREFPRHSKYLMSYKCGYSFE